MSDMQSEAHDRAARRIGVCINGKYTIQRLLGIGGMAAVYEATHRNSKRCAIKILHPELSALLDIRQRFLKEGYAANSVAHPGAVVVDDDDCTEDGAAYLVMELLEGETVDQLATRRGTTLDPGLATVIGDQLLDVLGAAHAKGIVHRDIKPENLFVNRGVQLKVLDFGIARLREGGGDSRRTVDGTVMGTPAFMPPEQASGLWAQVDARSDIWSVGATLYTLLTGRLVHEGSTVNEALAASITQAARPIRDYRPDLPAPIADVIDRALLRDKAQRFADAAAMRVGLRSAFLQVYGQELPPLSVALGSGGANALLGSLPTAMAPAGPWSQPTPAPGRTAVQPQPPWSLAGYGSASAPGLTGSVLGTSPPVTASQFKTGRTGRVALVLVLLLAGAGGAAALLLRGSGHEPAPNAAVPTQPPARVEPPTTPSEPAPEAPAIAPAGQAVIDIDAPSGGPPGTEPSSASPADPGTKGDEKVAPSEPKRPPKAAARPPRKPAPVAVARPAPPAPAPAPVEPQKPKKPFDPFAKRD